MRSAILKDVAHSDLEGAIGNYIETGWTVHELIPSSWHNFMTGPHATRSVTHWTVVLQNASMKSGGVETR